MTETSRAPYHRAAMGGRIFVFGSINTDLVVYVERLPLPGETVSGGASASFPGGKGANQAVAAARAAGGAFGSPGSAVEIFGCVGDDNFGKERLASLAEAGVGTAGVQVAAGAGSGLALIIVDEAGENTIAVAPGANMLFDARAVRVPPCGGGRTCVSLFQNELAPEAVALLVPAAKAAGHLVIWNFAPAARTRPGPETLRDVDYLVCNRAELSALACTAESPETGALLLRERGARNVIVTLGKEGSLWVAASGVLRQDAFPVKAVDTVGAGDCFCGVLAASLAESFEVETSLVRASAAAAISVTRRGAQTSMPPREEIERFMAERGA